MTEPDRLSIFTFNVGFGDCFLLRFSYPDNTQRHVLIDFGAHPAPKQKNHMKKVADTIAELCGRVNGAGGSLDIVVATHRHKDHISGFATAANKKGTGDVIASLNPKLVLQPWTENPDIPEDADDDIEDPMAGSHAFTETLKNMKGFAGALHQFASQLTDNQAEVFGLSSKEKSFLNFIGENNVSNKSAVDNLIRMGAGGKARYLHADEKLDVSDILPGVVIKVLGPPTVKQHPNVSIQKAQNEAEYWHLLAMDSAAPTLEQGKAEEPLFKNYVVDLESHARWMRYRLTKLRKEMLLPIVTALDNAMNNTSLILLFQVGNKSFLFPGDAQWENWQYALSKPEYVQLLKNVDLYKVGHHGSLNATPKSLWALFDHKGDSKKRSRLTSVMSTMHGVHGHTEKTAVPRSTLVEELKTHSHHHSTEDLPEGKLFEEIPFRL